MAWVADHLGWGGERRHDTFRSEWKFNIWHFYDPAKGQERKTRTLAVALKYAMPVFRPANRRVAARAWQSLKDVEEMMPMDLVEDATKALELMGCKVTPIPVEARRTPDFLEQRETHFHLGSALLLGLGRQQVRIFAAQWLPWPGEAAQTDFTSAAEFAVTLAGQLFVYLLCVTVLPYSNWQWATVCLSESLAALRRGFQAALFQLGRVPRFHQTDHLTAATHQIARDAADRTFNAEYLAVMRHFGIEPRTITVGAKEQNGDVEAGHRVLKRRLEQALLVRGSRDFTDQDEYERFVVGVCRKANAARGPRVAEDIEAMRPLAVARLPEHTELEVPVASTSTIRVKSCAYSVPSRLIGERVRVRLFEHRLEVYYADKLELSCDRLRGKTARIDYRHGVRMTPFKGRVRD